MTKEMQKSTRKVIKAKRRADKNFDGSGGRRIEVDGPNVVMRLYIELLS
jgi:hypothetical protein